jgi:hypothetical protein
MDTNNRSAVAPDPAAQRQAQAELGWPQVEHPEHNKACDRTLAFEPGLVRYIKLGEKGKWAAEALSQGIIPFGYRAVDHQACANADWEEVRRQLIGMGRTSGGASQGVRELRDFYELPNNTLWVAMADGHFWWAFAAGRVVEAKKADIEAPTRFRRTRNGWCRTSLTGVPLSVRSLSSALTSTTNYQMTICAIKQVDYLLRRIRGEIDPVRAELSALKVQTNKLALKMICRLDWRDFETLIDLIFTRGGWQRISALGGDQADVDLLLKQPVTGETAWVQVKSHSTQAELNNYLGRFERDGTCDRFFFVYHTAATTLILRADPKLHLWSAERVAAAAAAAGLLDWLGDHVT